jgi:hypothetical protein
MPGVSRVLPGSNDGRAETDPLIMNHSINSLDNQDEDLEDYSQTTRMQNNTSTDRHNRPFNLHRFRLQDIIPTMSRWQCTKWQPSRRFIIIFLGFNIFLMVGVLYDHSFAGLSTFKNLLYHKKQQTLTGDPGSGSSNLVPFCITYLVLMCPIVGSYAWSKTIHPLPRLSI